MKIAVTGATGYIGEYFVKQAQASGHKLLALTRSCPESFSCDWIYYDLSLIHDLSLPIDTEVILHLATSKSTDEHHGTLDITAAEQLMTIAQKLGAKFIFVSSQTARFDGPTIYGQTKWHIEQMVLSTGGWVVRPGQVYGGQLRGLFGTLVNTVKKLPVLPAFVLPTPKVQPIHVSDLSNGLLRIIERTDLPSRVYCLAASEPISFSRFLDEIAQSRLRCWRIFMPVPVILINAVIFILGKSLQTRFGLERLNSLFELPVMMTTSDIQQLGLMLRPLHSGMHPSGDDRRRYLLQEGQALFTYILKAPAGVALLRRYVRLIENLRGGKELALSRLFIKYPALLPLIEVGSTKTTWVKEFMWRLDGATILAEATPLGARRFLGIDDRHSFIRSFFNMAFAVMSELIWRILGVLWIPIRHIVIPQSFEEHS